MVLRFYNTLSRKKEPFKPIQEGRVGIYSCGPTVYNNPHIGNWRAFIFADMLRRYLKFKGYKVHHVMNLTDVDDKTIRDSQKEAISLKKFTDRYTRIFFEELSLLNIERVEEYPKATSCIDEMLTIIRSLLEKGYAYRADDGSVYYKVAAFPEYGKLSRIQFENLQSSGRVKMDEYEKETAADFALWKGYDEADGDVFWDTDFGRGRPGWHIECSAMSTSRLGQPFDIHTGGIDLIFPHHENEIAQSEGANGTKFVNFWLHNEHLLVDGEKMSKSLGNFYILPDILSKGFSPKSVRYLLMATHYRQKLNFTFEGLEAAKNAIDRIEVFMDKLRRVEKGQDNPFVGELVAASQKGFEDAMDDDLNISSALGKMFDFIKNLNKLIAQNNLSRNDALKAYNLIAEFDKLFGVLDLSKGEKVPAEILKLAEKREKAREKRDWKSADEIRQVLQEEGFRVEDTERGPVVKKL